jgi:hypothetical protein
MKKIIIYAYEDPDMYDECQIRRTLNVDGAYSALSGTCGHIRGLLKSDPPDDVYEALDKLRDFIYETMEDNGVNLDDYP